MRSYVQTYLERDLRQVTAVRDLGTFRRFLALLATRNAQLLNKTELAAPLGVTVPTITQWIAALEIAGLVMLVPPYFENLGKRLVKTPKVYFVDSGLLVFLLGIDEPHLLARSPLLGSVFEAFVASEIAKAQLSLGRGRELYFFRDQQGLEVDFVVPGPRGPTFLEAKHTKTLTPTMASPIRKLLEVSPGRGLLVGPSGTATGSIGPGVRAIPVDDVAREIGRR
jgi:predicted AAA+ superfamily ATPase